MRVLVILFFFIFCFEGQASNSFKSLKKKVAKVNLLPSKKIRKLHRLGVSTASRKCGRNGCWGRKPAGKVTHRCYAHVKHLLGKSGLMPKNCMYKKTDGFRPNKSQRRKGITNFRVQLSAKHAGIGLEQCNYSNICCRDKYGRCKAMSPEDAPIGSVLVYKGGKHGHIEVKTKNRRGQIRYVSDFIARKHSKRILTGVYFPNKHIEERLNCN